MKLEHAHPGLDAPISIGGVRFTQVRYDEEGDLLYLMKGFPLGPAGRDTREGHTVFRGANERVVGLLINGARWHLERDGAIEVTLVRGGPTTRLESDIVEPLLVDTPIY